MSERTGGRLPHLPQGGAAVGHKAPGRIGGLLCHPVGDISITVFSQDGEDQLGSHTACAEVVVFFLDVIDQALHNARFIFFRNESECERNELRGLTELGSGADLAPVVCLVAFLVFSVIGFVKRLIHVGHRCSVLSGVIGLAEPVRHLCQHVEHMVGKTCADKRTALTRAFVVAEVLILLFAANRRHPVSESARIPEPAAVFAVVDSDQGLFAHHVILVSDVALIAVGFKELIYTEDKNRIPYNRVARAPTLGRNHVRHAAELVLAVFHRLDEGVHHLLEVVVVHKGLGRDVCVAEPAVFLPHRCVGGLALHVVAHRGHHHLVHPVKQIARRIKLTSDFHVVAGAVADDVVRCQLARIVVNLNVLIALVAEAGLKGLAVRVAFANVLVLLVVVGRPPVGVYAVRAAELLNLAVAVEFFTVGDGDFLPLDRVLNVEFCPAREHLRNGDHIGTILEFGDVGGLERFGSTDRLHGLRLELSGRCVGDIRDFPRGIVIAGLRKTSQLFTGVIGLAQIDAVGGSRAVTGHLPGLVGDDSFGFPIFVVDHKLHAEFRIVAPRGLRPVPHTVGLVVEVVSKLYADCVRTLLNQGGDIVGAVRNGLSILRVARIHDRIVGELPVDAQLIEPEAADVGACALDFTLVRGELFAQHGSSTLVRIVELKDSAAVPRADAVLFVGLIRRLPVGILKIRICPAVGIALGDEPAVAVSDKLITGAVGVVDLHLGQKAGIAVRIVDCVVCEDVVARNDFVRDIHKGSCRPAAVVATFCAVDIKGYLVIGSKSDHNAGNRLVRSRSKVLSEIHVTAWGVLKSSALPQPDPFAAVGRHRLHFVSDPFALPLLGGHDRGLERRDIAPSERRAGFVPNFHCPVILGLGSQIGSLIDNVVVVRIKDLLGIPQVALPVCRLFRCGGDDDTVGGLPAAVAVEVQHPAKRRIRCVNAERRRHGIDLERVDRAVCLCRIRERHCLRVENSGNSGRNRGGHHDRAQDNAQHSGESFVHMYTPSLFVRQIKMQGHSHTLPCFLK